RAGDRGHPHLAISRCRALVFPRLGVLPAVNWRRSAPFTARRTRASPMRALSRIVLGGLVLLAGAPVAADVPKEDLPRILKDLKHGNAKARAQAAADAGHLGAVRASDAKDAVPLLLNLAKKDSDAAVRKAAAEALGNVGADPEEAVPVLIDRLEND